MSVRNLIVAAAVAAALPAAFAQTGALRGEAWYPDGAPAQLRQDLPAYGARSPVMPDLDYVAGDTGYALHQHQFMEQNELRMRAMGHRGMMTGAPAIRPQNPQEVRQYERAGG